MKPIVWVGLNPSPRNMSPEEAFVGSPSGKNLAKWQVEVDKGCDGFTHKMYNLCTLVSSDETDVDHTMADLGVMVRLMEHLSRGEPIVALGNKVSKILTANNIEHIPMPHPSPRNRQLNDGNFIKNKIKYLKSNIARSSLK